jgi:Tol biopolymer transport system component
MKSGMWRVVFTGVVGGLLVSGCGEQAVTFREVQRLEPVVSEKSGYTIEPRTVRAWVEDIEREAMGASNIVKLGDNQSIGGMAISADGTTLVFSVIETVKDELGNARQVASIRSIRTDGGGVTQVTSGQWLDAFPAFSSEGYVYFCSNRLRRFSPDIFRVSSKQIGAVAVIRQTPEGSNYQPSVSSTGVIAFTYKPVYQGGSDQVWTLGGESQYPTQLREGSMPAISPDGKQIAYIGADGQLWKVPINGQNPVLLTSSSTQTGGKKHPAWSPDGKHILYASNDGKDSKNEPNYDIWMMQEDGTGVRQLTTNGSVDDYPVISPDGKYVYFVSNRGFKEGIWRIPFPQADGVKL